MRKNRMGVAGLLLAMLFSIPLYGSSLRTARIFTDHMVLQRNMEVPVWGWGKPGAKIRLRFHEQQKETRCASDGRWEVRLAPMRAGGPYTMIIEDHAGKLVLEDILVGDVWLCSGQSNMWRPVTDVINADEEIENANFPEIRIFAFPRTLTDEPAEDILPLHPEEARITPMIWERCSPESIPDFSAVSYFFGKELYEKVEIPIGLIRTCWGGTPIEPWISEEALAKSEYYPDLKDQLVDPVARLDSVTHAYTSRITDRMEEDSGMRDGAALWAKPELESKDWKSMQLPVAWEEAGQEGLDGIVWFRKNICLPAGAGHESFILSLGRVYDDNQLWINGRYIGEKKGRIPGSPYYGSQPSSVYDIEPGIFKEGDNLITVRVLNYAGQGGMEGEAMNMYLQSENIHHVLAGPWNYKVGLTCDVPPPGRVRPHKQPTVLFNGMIAPLIPMAIKGAIWYQGESNTGHPVPYRSLFPRMIRDWRNRWGQGDFPFLFVQLANFGEPDTEPGDDNWGLMREAQAMTLSEPNTGMAVTIDIGEADNIHPRNKQDVGKRLALAAFHVAYDMDLVYSGPVFRSMELEGSRLRLQFDHTGTGLMLKDKYGYALGFAIAGADREWHWARGHLEGDTLVLYAPDVKTPVAVRYAWSKNPGSVNLYNKEGLPAVPFRTDDWDQE